MVGVYPGGSYACYIKFIHRGFSLDWPQATFGYQVNGEARK